jgi:hypothetical protein
VNASGTQSVLDVKWKGGINMNKEKIIEKATKYGNLLHQLKDQVGKLDDLYESPLINYRMPQIGYVGAYQYIQRAIDQLEGYTDEVTKYENS